MDATGMLADKARIAAISAARPEPGMISVHEEQGERAPRILLVEPNALDATIVRVLLERAGSDVDMVIDGAAALSRLRGEPLYDIVILDLPADTGLATVAAVRGLPGLRGRVPIVALGTVAVPADVRWIDRLEKPLRPRLLVERVRYRLAAADPRVVEKPIFDRLAFEAWCRRLSPRRAGVALDLFREQLQRATSAVADGACTRQAAASTAHGLVGSAGTLGFTRLYETSLALQEACHAARPEGWRGHLDGLRAALDAASDRLARLLADQSAAAGS